MQTLPTVFFFQQTLLKGRVGRESGSNQHKLAVLTYSGLNRGLATKAVKCVMPVAFYCLYKESLENYGKIVSKEKGLWHSHCWIFI